MTINRYGRRGVRTHRYTLCLDRGREGKKRTPLKVSLFDRQEDPFQMNDISEKNPELVKSLINNELIPWLKQTKDPWLEGEGNFPKL